MIHRYRLFLGALIAHAAVPGSPSVSDTGNRADFLNRGALLRLLLTAFATAISALGSQISTIQIGSSATFYQTTSAQPSVAQSYNFYTNVTLDAGDAVTVTPPGLSPLALAAGYNSGALSPLASYDGSFPPGNYTYTATSAGNSPVSVSVPFSPAYPPTPYLTDFAAFESMNPAAPFLLTWNSFGSAGDDPTYVGITLLILDLTSSSIALSAGLPVSATSYSLPAGTLHAGDSYYWYLEFTNANYGTYTGTLDAAPDLVSGATTFGALNPVAQSTVPEPESLWTAAAGVLSLLVRSRYSRGGDPSRSA